MNVKPPHESSFNLDFLIKWTPRAIAVAIGGYYGLGVAYEWGIMAQVDQVAIKIIKHFAGYAGIGALMPTVQWYSAWGVRIVMGLSLGLLYDIAERNAKFCYQIFKSITSPEETPHVAGGNRSL